MDDDFKTFANLIGSLIEKYIEKIDLDSLSDVPQHVENVNIKEITLNCLADTFAS